MFHHYRRNRRLASVALCSIVAAFPRTQATSDATIKATGIFATAVTVGANTQAFGGGAANNMLSARDMSDRLGETRFDVHVDVVLVGFSKVAAAGPTEDARGTAHGLVLDEQNLQLHLNKLVEGLSVDGKGGVPFTVVDQGHENELSKLGIRQNIIFSVTHADSQLGFQVSAKVESAIRDEKTKRGAEDPSRGGNAVVGIPRTAIDAAIRSDYTNQAQPKTHSLYLLHPGAQNLYQYVHDRTSDVLAPADENSGESDGENGSDRSRIDETTFPDGCGYIGWVGKSERYAWLDLGAHVQSGWGPHSRAFGIVSSSTLPDMREGRSFTRPYAELSALVHRTASHLMVPPVLFLPAGLGDGFQPLPTSPRPKRWSDYDTPAHDEEPEVVLVYAFFVCDATPCLFAETQAWSELEGLLGDAGTGDTDGEFLPSILVKQEYIDLLDSPLLAAGLQQAARSRAGIVTLASEELRYWLRLFLDAKCRKSKPETTNKKERVRTIPLFVFSLNADTPILLEHSMRSTVFPDMVVSVVGCGTFVDSGYQCEGRKVLLPGSSHLVNGVVKDDIENGDAAGGTRSGGSEAFVLRETVASLSQAIYGAPPRTLAWDPLTTALSTDYLWATGASMHTPLSSHSTLAYPERDAYVRTHVLRRVDAAIGAARDVLEQAAAVEPLLVNALNAGHLARVTLYWTYVIAGVEKSLTELAIHHGKSAVMLASDLETHVRDLGRSLSEGYGNGMHRATCLCGGGAGSAGEVGSWQRDVFSDFFFQIMVLATATLSAILIGWWRFRTLKGRWRERKRR